MLKMGLIMNTFVAEFVHKEGMMDSIALCKEIILLHKL